jgi:arylformamidase
MRSKSGKIIDISVPLRSEMPLWPGSTGIRISRSMSLEAGDEANVSRLDVHAGTHVEVPKHFLEKGYTIDQLSLEVLIGRAYVAYLPELSTISAGDLDSLLLPPGTERLLLRTRNSKLWAKYPDKFYREYVALTQAAARWLVDRGIRLIGVDYLSVQYYDEEPLVHQILLKGDVVIIESLNLDNVSPGEYELFCLPLNLVGAEAAPARVILRRLHPGHK